MPRTCVTTAKFTVWTLNAQSCLCPPGDITDEHSCFRTAEHGKFTNCSSINVNNSSFTLVSPGSAHVKQAFQNTFLCLRSFQKRVITFLNCKWFIDLRFILYLWFYVFWKQVLCFYQIQETKIWYSKHMLTNL